MGTYLIAHDVGGDTGRDLEDEDDHKEESELEQDVVLIMMCSGCEDMNPLRSNVWVPNLINFIDNC